MPGSVKTSKLSARGANGPTAPDCDPLIKERGIFLVPDFLANAGGVTCSYFEQVQCNNNYFWPKEEVLEKLNFKMTSAFQAVYKLSREKGLYMRDAAYVIAINRCRGSRKASRLGLVHTACPVYVQIDLNAASDYIAPI